MEQNRHYTLWLAGIIAAVFFLQIAFPQLTDIFKLVSADALSRPWTLLTSIFLHGSIVHLLYNGFGLAIFGSILEQVIGTRRLLMVFFGAGLFSGVASMFFYNAVLGASGAIFGILGAVAVLQPTLTVWVYYLPMPMYMAAVVWAAGDLLGFFVPTGVANAGHLAGLAAGIAAGFALKKEKLVIGSAKGSKIGPIVTAEEFDKWEKEHMRK